MLKEQMQRLEVLKVQMLAAPDQGLSEFLCEAGYPS
jgi:hypothetical protein